MLARGRPAALAFVLAVASIAVGGSPVRAAPIGVRAKTRVALEHRRSPTGMTLLGHLVDDADGAVASERITLELPGIEPRTRLTDSDGRFEVALDAREVKALRRDGDLVTWTARFDGNSRLGDTAETGTLDLSKRATRLRVTAPDGPIVLGDRAIEIGVELADVSEALPGAIAEAEIALEVGRGTELVGATGKSGGAQFVVRPSSLSGGGRYRITARFAGDALHAPSRAETEISVLLPTRVTLRVVREGDTQQGRYRMSGRASDQAGPLAGQVIGITAVVAEAPGRAGGSAFELVAATDRDGLWVTALGAPELQALRASLGGRRDRVRLEVRARYQPADGVHAPTESAPVILDIPPPPGVPLRWYALGLAAVVGAIALAQALRSGSLGRAWARAQAALRRLLARLLGRRPRPELADDEPAFVTRADGLAGATRARTSDAISGIIVDAHTRIALPGRVIARSGDARREALADVRGRFELAGLARGPWIIEVDAPGHLPREVVLEVPHNGDYDGAQWALVAVNRSVREIFAATLARMGTPLAWGFTTPREASKSALDALGQGAGEVATPLQELRAIVEHTHFSPNRGTAADVERARALKGSLERRDPGAPS